MYIWTGYTINAIKEESVRVLADNMVYTGEEAISEPRWGEDRLTVSVVKAQRASGRSCASSIGQADYKTASTVDSNISHSTMFPTPSSQQRHAGFSSSRSPQATHCAGRAAGRRTAVQKLCSFRGSRLMSSYYLQVAVFVLALTLQCSSSLRTSGSKEPLITTDAAQGDDFRTFMQSSSSDDDEVPTGRHAAADNMADDAGTLDFQSLKVIERWGNTTNILLVAGRDYVYMLDSRYSAGQPKKINYLERLTWRTPTKSQRECQLMGKKEYECQNFIRVVEVLEDDRLMVCGTNAYSPACRFYERHQFNDPSDSGSSFQSESTCQAQCVVPFNPATASATLYTETDSGYQIFAAVVNDFLGDEPTILRKETPTLFSNSHWLNEPTFLKILEYGDKVYVFFREVAKDSESDGDDDSTYARVAQMCKNDQGGVNVLAQQWTSFLKARLRCGHQGRGHLQFNNMTSVSDVVQYRDENGLLDDVIFATFSTPREWTDVSLSAVCAFSMRDIIEVFETGSFLGEIELDAKPKQKPNLPHMGGPSFSAQNSVKKVMSSYAVPRNEVPNPRPGSCRKVQTYPNVLYFAKEHPLMYDTIGPKFQAPIFVTFNGVKATQIAVDSNAGDDGHLMLYLGTEDGDVLRLRGMLSATKGPKAVFLESISAVEDKESCDNDTCVVRSLHVSRTSDRAGSTPSAFVAFSGHMVQFPLMRCALYQTSQCCSVDPGCGWTSQGKCVQRTRSNRYSLVPTTKAGSDLPKTCDVTSGKSNGIKPKCGCDRKRGVPCEDHDSEDGSLTGGGDVIEPDILDMIGIVRQRPLNLENILVENVLPEIQDQFKSALQGIVDATQQNALKKQLEEALVSTTNLVLKNHKQEYCLPTPTINHLTHVYPLLLREIEVWHQTALKKMTDKDFDKKCWSRSSRICQRRISFSVPLAPALWEPLTKLITDFVGNCSCTPAQQQGPGKCSLPGLERCTDTLQPHCGPKHCKFPQYAVDVKAFFRHANDTRRFLSSEDVEPLWKPVNVTLSREEAVRGHLELVVSDRLPFVVDYSPVAEKVKITFYYTAVRDCDLTQPGCVGTNPGCNPEVEGVLDGWFRLAMRKMSHKMRRCSTQLRKGKRARRHGHLEFAPRPASANSRWRNTGSNLIQNRPDRCRKVRARLRPKSVPVLRNMWPLIVSRSERSGGVYVESDGSIEFYRLEDVIAFFKNTCTFERPTPERRTFRKRSERGRKVEPMVSPETPFVIHRLAGSDRIVLDYFTRESLGV